MLRFTNVLKRLMVASRPLLTSTINAGLNQLPRIALTQFNPIRTFKVKTSVKKMCKECYMVRRKGKVYVYCKANGKHKQRQA